MEIKLLKNKNFLYKVITEKNMNEISQKFKINKIKILKDNKLINENLERGDILFIENENNVIYVVKPLDTLIKISKKFNVSVDFIKEKNQLINEHIFIGQVLIF